MQQGNNIKVVYIPTSMDNLQRQTAHCSSEYGEYKFIFGDNQPYDYFVVLDNLSKPIECKVDKLHTIAFLGEPPYVNLYNRRFLSQFGHVIGCSRSLPIKGYEISMPVLPWMIGDNFRQGHENESNGDIMIYDDFKTMPIMEDDRQDKVCIITSNKKFTCGHRRRVEFVERLKQEHPDLIDVYGNGYYPIADKYEVLSKYKYALVIENCQYMNYWTEKLGDTFLAGAYPIYYGCPNIREFFDISAFTEIDINNYNVAVDTIKRVVDNRVYSSAIKYLEECKGRVLDKYNMFTMIANAIDKLEPDVCIMQGECRMIYPLKLTIIDKIKLKIARKFEIVI